MRYFDISFLIPLILPEAASDPVAGFFEDLPADDLAVSHWSRVEFASLLDRNDLRSRIRPSRRQRPQGECEG